MGAYTMKRSTHANQCRRGISHHPEYGVTAFSWGRKDRGGGGGGGERGRKEDVNRGLGVASLCQPRGDAVADLVKARALSFNKRARTTYRPIRRAPRGQIDGVITESGSVFLREMAASGRRMIISANKREILDLLPYRLHAVEIDGTPR